MKTIAMFILGLVITVAFNVASASAQDANIEKAQGVSFAVLNGLTSAASYTTAKDCVRGDKSACIQVLAETAIVSDAGVAEELNDAARSID